MELALERMTIRLRRRRSRLSAGSSSSSSTTASPTVRALSGLLRALCVSRDRFCVAVLHGRGGRLAVETWRFSARAVAKTHGVARTMNPPAKLGRRLIKPDAPWEAALDRNGSGLMLGLYSSVLREQPRAGAGAKTKVRCLFTHTLVCCSTCVHAHGHSRAHYQEKWSVYLLGVVLRDRPGGGDGRLAVPAVLRRVRRGAPDWASPSFYGAGQLARG
jgi:hypothetical protein